MTTTPTLDDRAQNLDGPQSARTIWNTRWAHRSLRIAKGSPARPQLASGLRTNTFPFTLLLLVAAILLSGCQDTQIGTPADNQPQATPADIQPSPTPTRATAPEVEITLTAALPSPEPTEDDQAQQELAALDAVLEAALKAAGITPLDPGPAPDPSKVTLGQALFFDKILGGGQSVSCATCHHPRFGTGDALSLSIGVGGTGLGPDRVLEDDRDFIARNAPELFNRGSPEWTTMFWDNRVSGSPLAGFDTPAEEQFPNGLDSVLAAQAMFPVTSDQEMRAPVVADGRSDAVAHLSGEDFAGIWQALTERVLEIPEYRELFAAAYPGIPAEQLGFEHIAGALAAFQIDAWTLLDSPWDRYTRGDHAVLSEEAKRGALLFYGKAGCFRCHSGSLFTDQKVHNVAVPQLGPGKGTDAPLDIGRARETYEAADLFAFRTPPLRNVELTGPWMHNGAYTTLESAVEHMLSPRESLLGYDAGQIAPLLQPTVQGEQAVLDFVLETLDPFAASPIELSEEEFGDLMAFLRSLTDPAATDLEDVIPASVPSGLPLED